MKIKKKKKDSNATCLYWSKNRKRNKLTIGTVYRPLKQQEADDASLYEEIHAMTKNKQSVIIGDFNCPKINWSSMNVDQEGNRLLEMLEATSVTQIITQPT